MVAEPYRVIPLSPLRKVIAARMTEAARTIPHFRLVADIEVDTLLALRAKVNAAQPACKVSVNDCILKACASTLMMHPALNVQLMDNEIHQYTQADISVVVAVTGGLSTPVIRGANHKSVRDIAAEMKALAARAAAGQLRMDEILGGSFSVSNLGGYGVDEFDAIINAPQCAILAVGRARPRIVLDRAERIAQVMRVTLSADHRVIDGTRAAEFLAALRESLQEPQGLFEESSREITER